VAAAVGVVTVQAPAPAGLSLSDEVGTS
jgi:hypothetical protein